jgi:hypothetical protein
LDEAQKAGDSGKKSDPEVGALSGHFCLDISDQEAATDEGCESSRKGTI